LDVVQDILALAVVADPWALAVELDMVLAAAVDNECDLAATLHLHRRYRQSPRMATNQGYPHFQSPLPVRSLVSYLMERGPVKSLTVAPVVSHGVDVLWLICWLLTWLSA
jgi:hypothetical protein